MTNEPSVGAIGLVKVHGGVGLFIRLGQWLAGGGFADYEHAFVCVSTVLDGGAQVVEAEPGGASMGVYFPADEVLWSNFPLTVGQQDAISQAALKYLRTPYSFLDYLAMALHRFRLPIPFLKGYVTATGHMICSQLADR